MKQSDADFAACPIAYPTDTWRAHGIRAVDGDTIVVRMDRGFFETTTMELRLLGIDTWELFSGDHRDLGLQAKQFTEACVGNQWLVIRTRMDPDKYGRLLAYVDYPTAAGQYASLSEALTAAGFAKVGT